MPTHMTATRDKWPEARLDLLAAEKDLTRRSDDVARLRQQLPWVRGDKNHTFDTEEGHKVLKDLFGGRSQLLRQRGTSGKPRCRTFRGVACAAREAASVQATDGLDVSLGIIGPRGV